MNNLHDTDSENEAKIEKSEGLTFLLFPFIYQIQKSWQRKIVKSKHWNYLKSKSRILLCLTLISFFLILLCCFMFYKFLTNRHFVFAFIVYLIYCLFQYPASRLLLIHLFNKALKNLDNGRLDPDLRRNLKLAKLHHEWNFAPIKHSKMFQKNDVPRQSIGVRVNPIESAISYTGREPKLTKDELKEVTNSGYAIFPLNEKSPDHHLVIGQTGSGKTVLIRHMISTALSEGWQVALLDLKGNLSDAPNFINLAKSKSRVRHFPSVNFDFWTGEKLSVAERVISIIPPNTNSFYMNRIIAAVHAVITSSPAPSPTSVEELLNRLHSPKNYVGNIEDLNFLTSKSGGQTVGDLIASDLAAYMHSIRVMEKRNASKFRWSSDWDLGVFSLDCFQITSLLFTNVILNDLSTWIFNSNNEQSRKPLLLIIDEASALQRLPEIPVLSALMQRARSARVSIVLASQTYTAFGKSSDEIIHSGSIRWLGQSSLVEEMIEATGTKSVIESGYQSSDGILTGVVTHREQKEFKIDPDAVRTLPTFFWYVSKNGKTTSLYVPPKD